MHLSRNRSARNLITAGLLGSQAANAQQSPAWSRRPLSRGKEACPHLCFGQSSGPLSRRGWVCVDRSLGASGLSSSPRTVTGVSREGRQGPPQPGRRLQELVELMAAGPADGGEPLQRATSWAPGWEVLRGHPGKGQPEQGCQEESPVRAGESGPRVLGGYFPIVAPGPHLPASNHCSVVGQTPTHLSRQPGSSYL